MELVMANMKIDELNRNISYIKTYVRNLIIDIEEDTLTQEDVIEQLKNLIGE